MDNLPVDKKRILISGDMGLIGSGIKRVLENKFIVKGYDLKSNITIESFENESFDFIIHCGAHCVIREIISNPELAFENIRETGKIMEKARKDNSKVIMFSSNRVAHDNICNPYTVCKGFNEEICRAYSKCYGVDYLVIRPETVWGFENENNVRVIPAWIECSKNNKPILIYGDKEKELSPVFVDDFVNEFIKIFLSFEQEKFNTFTITGKTQKAESVANHKSFL
jgi:nucleoside-diphosphate-sugar epimerase